MGKSNNNQSILYLIIFFRSKEITLKLKEIEMQVRE